MITSNNLAGVWTLRDGWRVAFSELNHAANILRGSAGWLIARNALWQLYDPVEDSATKVKRERIVQGGRVPLAVDDICQFRPARQVLGEFDAILGAWD